MFLYAYVVQNNRWFTTLYKPKDVIRVPVFCIPGCVRTLVPGKGKGLRIEKILKRGRLSDASILKCTQRIPLLLPGFILSSFLLNSNYGNAIIRTFFFISYVSLGLTLYCINIRT